MDSGRLSRRTIQPGHVRTFTKSEDAFHDVALMFEGVNGIKVTRKPTTLARFYLSEGDPGKLGLIPEEEILHTPSQRRLFFEIKNQGPGGNAEERAYKHHTRIFEERLMRTFRLGYHPYFTIFTGNLATDQRYTKKFPHHIDADHYFLWPEYNTEGGRLALYAFLNNLIQKYLLRHAHIQGS